MRWHIKVRMKDLVVVSSRGAHGFIGQTFGGAEDGTGQAGWVIGREGS